MVNKSKKSGLAAACGLLAVLLLSSCASQWALMRARGQLDRGDPVGAVISAAEAFRHDPKNYAAAALLADVFPAAVADRRAAADAAEAGGAAFRWETVAGALSDIHAMNDAVAVLPDLVPAKGGAPVVLDRTYYRAELESARTDAAAERYAAGLAAAALKTKSGWRDAARHYVIALAFRPDYLDAARRAEEARELGSDHVFLPVFESFAANPAAADFAAMLNDVLAGQMVGAARGREFVQIVERSRVEELLVERELAAGALNDLRINPQTYGFYGADIVVFGSLSSLIFKNPTNQTTELPFTAEINETVPTAAPVNGVIPTQKVAIAAKVTVISRQSAVSGSAAYRVVRTDSGVVLDSISRSATIEDKYEWAIISGDPRAVPPHYKALAMKKDQSVKLPQAMLGELAAKLTEGVADAVLAKIKR